MMRSLLLLASLIACDGGDTDLTEDTELPLGCQLVTNADQFGPASPIAVGDDIALSVVFEAQCREAVTLSFAWREPTTGAWTLPASLQADPTLVLQPYAPQTVDVTFAPTQAGSFRDQVEVLTDNVRIGGVILTFTGEGE